MRDSGDCVARNGCTLRALDEAEPSKDYSAARIGALGTIGFLGMAQKIYSTGGVPWAYFTVIVVVFTLLFGGFPLFMNKGEFDK